VRRDTFGVSELDRRLRRSPRESGSERIYNFFLGRDIESLLPGGSLRPVGTFIENCIVESRVS